MDVGRLMGGLTPMIWTLLVVGTAWTPPLVTLAWCVCAVWFDRRCVVRWPSRGSFAIIRAIIRGSTPPNGTEIERGRETGEASHTSVPVRSLLAQRQPVALVPHVFLHGLRLVLPHHVPAVVPARPFPSRSAQHARRDSTKAGRSGSARSVASAGGFLVDWLIRRTGNRKRTRRFVGMTAEGLCALGWVAAIFAPNVHCFFLAISLAALCNDMTLASRLGHVPGYRRALHRRDRRLHEHGRHAGAVGRWLTARSSTRAVHAPHWKSVENFRSEKHRRMPDSITTL